MGSADLYCPDFAWEISELSTPVGNFFLQSKSLPISVDLKNSKWNPLLLIIQQWLTRFWHKASLAQIRARGKPENIPEPFNNPWLVFKLKIKAKIRENLQILGWISKLLSNLWKIPTIYFHAGRISQTPNPALASERMTVLFTRKTGLRGMKEDRGCVGKLPGKHTVQFTFVWMHSSLSKVPPSAPLYRECYKFTAVYGSIVSCWS